MTCRQFTAFCAGVVSLAVAEARAADINYGSFGPTATGVTFNSVTESSGTDPVPLFGPPVPFATGLDFDPLGFTASATAGASDTTFGSIRFTITGASVKSVSVFEAGDYTLAGTGTPATQASAAAILRATVTAIDGVNVAPIALIPVNASVGFGLPANAGVVQPWSLGLSMNVEAQLTALSIPFNFGATGVDVVIDNTLTSISQTSSVAFIAKKEFRFEAAPGIVPEPATAALLGVGFCCLALRRRRI